MRSLLLLYVTELDQHPAVMDKRRVRCGHLHQLVQGSRCTNEPANSIREGVLAAVQPAPDPVFLHPFVTPVTNEITHLGRLAAPTCSFMSVGLPHDHRRSDPHSRGQLRVMACLPGKAQRVAARIGQMPKYTRPSAVTGALRQDLDPRRRFDPWPPVYPPRTGSSRYIGGSRRHPVLISWPFDLGERGQVADFWVLTCRHFPLLIQVRPIGQGW